MALIDIGLLADIAHGTATTASHEVTTAIFANTKRALWTDQHLREGQLLVTEIILNLK